MPAAIEAFGCAFLQSLLLLQSFAVISIFYHTSCRYYMTASFSGQPSAVPAVFHIAFSACLRHNVLPALCPLFPFAAIPAALRSFLLPFSVAIYHLARILSVCTITALSALCLLFPFAIILAAPRSFLLPFSLACLLSAPFAALFYCRICLLCRPFCFIPHPPRISLKTALPIHPDSKPKSKLPA